MPGMAALLVCLVVVSTAPKAWAIEPSPTTAPTTLTPTPTPTESETPTTTPTASSLSPTVTQPSQSPQGEVVIRAPAWRGRVSAPPDLAAGLTAG